MRRSRDLLVQALRAYEEGLEHLPGTWGTVCRRVKELRLLLDSVQIREGRNRALQQLAHEAEIRRSHFERAESKLREALQYSMNDPELLFILARLLSNWEKPGPLSRCSVLRKDRDAIEVYQMLRHIDPEYEADRVAFALGILFTRQRKYAQAIGEYKKAIALSLDQEQAVIIHSNLAEVVMLKGDLHSAVAYYERALSSSQQGRDYLLALWGQAVALDRLGEHDSALDNVERAITMDGGSMRVLRSDGVFFEPEHEFHYYQALGYEVLARLENSNVKEALRNAEMAWTLFLEGAGEDSQWTPAARANLQRIQNKLRQR